MTATALSGLSGPSSRRLGSLEPDAKWHTALRVMINCPFLNILGGMTFPLHFADLNSVQRWALSLILSEGRQSAPRSKETLEVFPAVFALDNPRARQIKNAKRRWSLPLAIGEFAWHVSGSNKVDFISYYTPHWQRFSDDGLTIKGSSYGYRIFSGNPNRWSQMLDLLKADPNTRRGVLVFADAHLPLQIDAKDVPCATSVQFLLRDNRLHASVSMRSNDVIWGLPYDTFLFSMLQELCAVHLNVQLGTYYHSAMSLHLYKEHFSLAEEVLSVSDDSINPMPPMEAAEQLPVFLRCEESLRAGVPLAQLADAEALATYWQQLLAPLESYRRRKYTPESTRG
jgi:thymidylate synthase